MSKAEHDELVCVYAALLLSDENLEITVNYILTQSEKLNKVIAASGNTVEGYYTEFFERYFKTVNVNTLLSSIGSGAVAGPASSEAAKDDKKDAKADKKDDKKSKPVEKPKVEEPPAEEDAGGFGDLFG